jgi:hypothetical protein
VVDGQVVFSKAQTGRFPVDGEVEQLFASLKPDAKRPEDEDPKSPGRSGAEGVLSRLAGKLRN